MIQVNVQDAKAQLSRLLTATAAGEEVIIAKNGVPVARLSSFTQPAERELGFLSVTVGDAFFEPLPEAELAAWEA